MQKQEKKDDGFRSEFWGICCESGKKYSQVVCKKFHISMAALDPTGNDSHADTMTSPCVSLMVERDGCQYLLCSLKPDSILQVVLNLYFDKGENITFFLKGHGTVHLSGYYCNAIDSGFADSSRKDQINTLSKREVKKPQTSFTVSADVESSDDDDEESSDVEEVEMDLIKGKAVSPVKKPFVSPVKTISPKESKSLKVISKEDSSDDDDSEDEDSEDEPVKTEDSKKLKTYATKRVRSSLESDESSDDDEDDSSDDAALTQEIAKINSQFQNKKKFKADTPNADRNKRKQKTPIKLPAVIDLENNAKTGKPDLNSSIGRTPMPKKPTASLVQQVSPIDSFLSKMKNQCKTPKKDSSDSDEIETSATNMPDSTNQLNTSAQTESAKKKKKKKKSKTETTENQVVDTPNKSPSKPQFSQKLPSGVEYDDIRVGNGPIAKKGKLVHVYYTGKLENNKIFDSCQQGSKPFSFKLASGQVIKGWDFGIEGMKVGGKRRLKIPPHMGYGNKQMGAIPSKSTLYFVVELKAVS